MNRLSFYYFLWENCFDTQALWITSMFPEGIMLAKGFTVYTKINED